MLERYLASEIRRLIHLAMTCSNDGGLMKRVMVVKVGGRGKGYALGVYIQIEAWLNHFDL